ncbi:MAG TPA: alpha-L-fucosidase, partial [Candidatus Hydrogenedentes bacterium]|nr:alpha-L-fucosidase [Candidatus Hydrogenedentota bacterium]
DPEQQTLVKDIAMKNTPDWTRRRFLEAAPTAAISFAGLAASTSGADPVQPAAPAEPSEKRGYQRLSLEKLRAWESLEYGMFIHFGMSTFVGQELPSGNDPLSAYAPESLDVAQWISVARDAGMRYAVLTAKHVAGHCLWPSRHTDYTVANSPVKVDVVEQFVRACESRGVLPGLYYCSWDNHHRFGSRTPSDGGQPFTTSLYQTFQTAQLTELLTQYGPIAEVWIDIPSVLGRGYRTFLYQHIAALQPYTVIMMNSGISEQREYDVEANWPADLVAIERRLPPEEGFPKWRTIEGKPCYMPGEVCDPIGKEWFWVEGDLPRPDEALAAQFEACRQRGVNLLLDVPPDRRGLIPDSSIAALQRLRKAIGR